MPGDKAQGIPPVPSHWKLPRSHPLLGSIPRWSFQGLCLISVHRPSMEHHWKSKCDETEWFKHMNEMVGQLNNSNVACGLLLATTSVFLTTPPPMQSVLNYATTSSYVLALVSFAHALGGILTGTAVIAIYQSCERDWTREVLTATRLRLCLILLLMAWPSISLFLSIVFLMASMLTAVLAPSLAWLQAAVGLELVLWTWTLPAFIFCTSPLRNQRCDQQAESARLTPPPHDSQRSNSDGIQECLEPGSLP
ncbi:hypothetical protein K503DRAFT_857259 [Rhizopogon vinicolor AM-OR11-026]|uniref:Uncharacterized protein n=1 Tax=Rhizopogon vinicolor AM-OR11-026 TaxID=1314800 RepID=A0A1B7MYC2_9AGAM|nr:hypothetical protein K503DRAFT_857259 [Rhizopogon vinicolor AM-OR11-026]